MKIDRTSQQQQTVDSMLLAPRVALHVPWLIAWPLGVVVVVVVVVAVVVVVVVGRHATRRHIDMS